MDRLIFGDNQFFGINHMSEEKARAQARRFQRIESIIEVLDAAYDEGISSFMCTTHDRVGILCEHVRQHPHRYGDFRFLPCMPYAHKYANAVTEDGLLGALKRLVPQEGIMDMFTRGGLSIARRDIEGLVTLLVDAEMKMFSGLETPVVFLQNVVVDLLLGLGMHEPLLLFSNHVKKRYNAEPGFITMNLPMLLDTLDELGIDNPIVCSNINKIGFRMCGGQQAYEDALSKRRFRAIAMSVFASGGIPAKEAIEWVCSQPKIESIVFGASGRDNIVRTKELVERHWAPGFRASGQMRGVKTTQGDEMDTYARYRRTAVPRGQGLIFQK